MSQDGSKSMELQDITMSETRHRNKKYYMITLTCEIYKSQTNTESRKNEEMLVTRYKYMVMVLELGCKSLSLHLDGQHPLWAPDRVPAAPLPIHLPANVPGKALEDVPTAWATVPKWETWGPALPLRTFEE